MHRFKVGALMLVATLLGLPTVLWALPSRASPEALEEAERRMLSGVRTPFVHRMVLADGHLLHTVILGDPAKPPLVMLHGHGGGLAVFAQNFDALAARYCIYAVDLLGWGRSERPRFRGKTAEDARDWWVTSIESWRVAMKLEHFTLLGHSMGGFVAGSYAMAHPGNVSRLILVDSGGVTRPVKLRNGIYFNLTPQRIVRLAGPLGPALVAATEKQETKKGIYPGTTLADYYYQLSAAPPSGEVAFSRLLGLKTWALPLLDRAAELTMPVTLIWGADDQVVSMHDGEALMARVPQANLLIIPGSGHAPYSEMPARFNQLMLEMKE